jgi:hypothetical protein
MKPGLILQHGPTSPPGLSGECANGVQLFHDFWERAQRAERRDP